MTDIKSVVAGNIRAYRKGKGLTQAQLAEQAGTSTHYIAMIEGGKNFPSPDMIEKISAVLEKDTVDLFNLSPIQHYWKEMILSDIEILVNQKLNEINSPKK
jgi:transcriptional regulator with XRE-family HTH domain